MGRDVRRSAAKKRRKNKNILNGVILLSLSLGTIVAVTLFYQHLINTRVEVDPETLCPVVGPTEIVAVLVDSTDPFSGVQKDFLVKYLDEFEVQLKKGALIQIYSAADFSESSFEPVANLCNPGDGKDISEWSGNPQKVRKLWESSFRQPLTEALMSTIEVSESDTSPLMSMIKAVSYKAFPATVSTVPKKMFIVSDMLEHTKQYSQYSDSSAFEGVSHRPFFSHLSPNLQKVEVSIIYISRPGFEQLQTRRHAEFWSNYFMHVGASLQSIKRI